MATAKKPLKQTGPKKKAAAKKAAPKPATKTGTKKAVPKEAAAKKSPVKKWSAHVNETSDAMDLEQDIFKSKDPNKIAASVKKSAENSKRKKAGPFQSAMSMINFYENRGGKNISAAQKKVLDQSKEALRKLFGKEET